MILLRRFPDGEDTLKTIMSYFLKTKCEDDPETINVYMQCEVVSACSFCCGL